MTYPTLRMKSLFACILALVLSSPAFAQIPPMPRMVSVTGEAEEKFLPDQAILSGALISRDRELNIAKMDNDKMVERIVALIRDFKIPKEKVSASNVYISPEYSYENGKQHFKGYMVNRQLSIIVDNMAIHERVLSALIDAKVDQVNGVQFQLSNYEAKAKDIRVKAVKNAREKAEALAHAAGAKLGHVLSISTSGTSHPMPPVAYARAAMMDSASEKASVAPSLPGEIAIHEAVAVSFALE
jgi:uncharacterized protein